MRRALTFFIPAVLLAGLLSSAEPNDLSGTWELVPQKSTVIPLYRSLTVDFRFQDRSLSLAQKWGTRPRDAFTDTVTLPLDGTVTRVPLQHQVAPTNVFLGIRNLAGGRREMSASLSADGTILTVRECVTADTSQGAAEIEAVHTYTLSIPDQVVVYRVTRPARAKGDVLSYTLKRAGSRQACYMRLKDDWTIAGGLPQQAFLISLQGLANSEGAVLGTMQQGMHRLAGRRARRRHEARRRRLGDPPAGLFQRPLRQRIHPRGIPADQRAPLGHEAFRNGLRLALLC